MAIVQSAAFSDVGRRRKGNEDSYFRDDGMQLYIVADGMGGHQAGDVASRIVAETIPAFITFHRGSGIVGELPTALKNLSKAAQLVNSGILHANDVVYRSAQKDEAHHGMGSTVSVVFFDGDTLVVGNVGDSPVFLVRNGAIKLVSVQHTMMAEFLATAAADAEAPNPKWRHVLTRAMGTKVTVIPDISEISAFKEDIFVISSDGLSDKVEPEEIMGVVVSKPPEAACRSLVDLANQRGGEDNITVIVLKILELGRSRPGADAEAGKTRIAVEFDSESESHRGLLQKIEGDHLFIKTREAVPQGRGLTLILIVENASAPLMFDGKVIRRRPGGFEVKLENLTQKNIEQLRRLETRL